MSSKNKQLAGKQAKKKNKPAKTQPQPPLADNRSKETLLALQRYSEEHSGPLPAPFTMEQYETILPGSAERIVSMAEKEQKHRHSREREIVWTEMFCKAGGLICGLVIGLAAILGGIYAIVSGHDVAGTLVGGAGLTGLVSVFVVGSREKQPPSEKGLQPSTSQPDNQSSGQ